MSSPPVPPPRLGGRALEVADGETLAQALSRAGVPLLGRSVRYHRPRAPFCGIGACSQCVVSVNGQPNVRACRYTPRPGDRIETMNAWPSARWDLLGLLDLLFYRGLDTLHGFRRPRWATPLYHRVVRRLAGYGPLPDAPLPPRAAEGRETETDVAIVGGGRSGRACAARLASAGRRVHLVDRSVPASLPAGGEASGGFTAVFLPPPLPEARTPFRLLATTEDGRALSLRARSVVIATGGYDAGLLFDGNDRPGVLTGDGAEAFTGGPERPPFHHAVLFGGDRRAVELLDRFGPGIDAVVAPGAIVPGLAERAAQLDIPLYPRTLLLATRGRSRVRAVSLRARGEGRPFSLAADAVLLAHRRLPTPQLFFQAGARMEWRAGTGAYYPVLERGVETSVPGLYAVGEAAGFATPEAAEASGLAAADQLLGGNPEPPAPRVDAERPTDLFGYLRELRPLLAGLRRPVACACEDVLWAEVEEAHRAGFRGMEVIKRYTGLGTGLCQGRYCLPDTLLLLSVLEDRPPPEVGYITQRPPVFPAPLDALARLPEAGPEGSP